MKNELHSSTTVRVIGWPGLMLGLTLSVLISTAMSQEPATTPPVANPAPTNPNAIVRFSVDPPSIHLQTTRDHQTLVGQVEFANGLTNDVTREMTIEVQPAELVQLEGNLLRPRQDGDGKIVVRYGDRSVELPLVVRQAAETLPLSFRLDVMPVFMRSGCNTGSCHGAARGKDGFNLSLFGFDPAGDYNRLLREQLGRRVDLAFPERSLLLEKSIGAVSHSGGSLFKPDSRYYKTLLEWLQNGAPDDAGAVPQVVGVELFPAGGVLNGPDTTQQLTVVANYSDGTTRDVTELAYFSSANDNSATVSQAGVVTAANRGEAFVMARYDTHTVGRHFIVLPKDLEFAWKELPANNYIDELMYEKWKRLRIEPSSVCDDATFLRRVSLDICGMLPTSVELDAFLADPDAGKRAKKIDELLERKEFVEMWVMKWAELLQIRSTINVSYKSALLYFNWLQQQIANDVPIDAMVRDLLASKGGTFSNPATNYYQMETDTLKVAENVAQVFMGMRTQCAQCHNHPFDRWTMDDYYSFAAFFSQVGRKPAEDPREVIVFNSGGGDVRHLVGGRVMAPKFLGGAQPEIQPGQDRREVLAKWLASPENPYFARNLSNMVWAHFFGKGIINDVDDVRVSNPAVNEPLLEALSSRFTEYKYDFKQLVRDICNSRTYQLSTELNESNASDETNFSRRYLNRMRAEVMLDVISQVTDTGNKFRGLAYGARAVQIADGNTSNYFLTTFGRATRETVCSCEVVMEPNLSQALHLLNGETVHQKCREGGLIAKMIGEGRSPADVITEIYQRAFSRKPQETELQQLLEMVAGAGDVQDGLHDVFWAVLNTPEFMFNH
ncbi:MAG: DUF1549 domain-containing protein [Planctomycetaceae bacterium]|nr:DUF1549 domain-containing protein [Planctomycetaceae bacterium]